VDLKNEVVLEVGCGNGNLTEVLLEKSKEVIGFEVDSNWCDKLKERFGKKKNFTLICNDFLTFKLEKLKREKMVFFSNIPYYISTKIIEKLIDDSQFFQFYYMMVQWEFGKRLFSQPKSKDYSSLSVFFQSQFSGKILKKVPASVFTPRPKVDSAFIYFKNDQKIPINEEFQEFVKFLFSRRRKQIISTLRLYCKKMEKNDIIKILNKLEINEKERVENLPLNFLYNLYNSFSSC